jgi:hypothetical protein
MRVALTLLAASLPLAALAQAVTLPGLTPKEAGQTAELATSVCLVAPSRVNAYTARLDTLVVGTTHSAQYVAGQNEARAQVRQALVNDGNVTEMRAANCNEIVGNINRVIEAQSP